MGRRPHLVLDNRGRLQPGQSMARMFALTVVCQHLDDAAFADLSVPAAFDHVLEFGFQGREVAYPLNHFGQPGLGDGVGGRAGLAGIVLQGQQRPDGLYLESQLR
jgi:hypothetical protein